MYVHVYWYFYARLKEDTIIKSKITVVSIMFISINFHGFCKKKMTKMTVLRILKNVANYSLNTKSYSISHIISEQ